MKAIKTHHAIGVNYGNLKSLFDAEGVTPDVHPDVNYIAVRAQLHAGFNVCLSDRMPGLTLENWEHQLIKAKKWDNARELAGERPINRTARVWNTLKWGFRDNIKHFTVLRTNAELLQSKAGFEHSLLEVTKLRDALVAAMQRAKVVATWDLLTIDLPLWEEFAFVGEDKAGNQIFEKKELWTVEEFAVFIRSKKWQRNVATWAISNALASEILPSLVLPDSKAAFLLLASIDASIEAKNKRAKEQGRDIWDARRMLAGGVTFDSVLKDGYFEAALSILGMVVKRYNVLVDQASYQIGKVLYGQRRRAGMNIGEYEFTVLGEYRLLQTADNRNHQNLVAISPNELDYQELLLDFDTLKASIVHYLEEWYEILPPQYLEVLERPYHGGLEPMNNPNGELGFRRLPLQFAEIEAYLNKDVYLAQLERAKKYAVEKDNRQLEDFVPRAITF